MKFKKLFSTLALAAAMTVGAVTVPAVTQNASAAEAIVCETTTAFDAVRFTQQRTVSEWTTQNGPTGQIFFMFKTDVHDWSQATNIRFRIQSNKIQGASDSSNGNNLAIGFGGKMDFDWIAEQEGKTQADADLYEQFYGNDIVRMINNKYADGVKFTKEDGSSSGNVYFIDAGGPTLPYFNMGRLYNGFIEASLAADQWQQESSSEGSQWKRPNNGGGFTWNIPVDMTTIDHFFIKLEPKNYAGMCIDIGNIDIKINGEWVNVVNVSETELVKKEEGKTWVETYQGMTANQVLMDPNRIDSYNSTTTTFTMTYVEATPCAEHNDGNSDGVCDRCFKRIPHELWDIDENGKCDDCQKTYCESCTDADNDGTCDECYHFVENYVEPPVGGDPNGGGTNSGNNGNNGNNSSSGKKGGCKGAIGGVTAGAILGLGAVCTFLKKKRK